MAILVADFLSKITLVIILFITSSNLLISFFITIIGTLRHVLKHPISQLLPIFPCLLSFLPNY